MAAPDADHFAAAAARLDAWLTAGGTAEPAALALARALCRRGQAQDAAVRAWLAPRLARAVDRLHASACRPVVPPQLPSLAALRTVLPVRDGPELAAARALRPALARWRIAGELSRAEARRPENPGPLNSEHLLLRALQRLQADAPELLGAVVTQVETLLWLDAARGAGAPRTPTRR